jgi:hypothetical protein
VAKTLKGLAANSKMSSRPTAPTVESFITCLHPAAPQRASRRSITCLPPSANSQMPKAGEIARSPQIALSSFPAFSRT